MNREAIIERITKLLRLARDQEGTPEGKTAASLARLLMRRAGVEVVLEERQASDAKCSMLDVEPLPIPWKEYLAVTLSVAYRCECVPRWTGFAWQIWTHASEPERVSSCEDHYSHLREQISNRTDRVSSRFVHLRHSDEERYENLVNSYAEGIVYEASVVLLAKLGWKGVLPFMQSGFDLEDFIARAKDPLDPSDDESNEPGIRRYLHQAPADPLFEDEDVEPPPNKVLDTDPVMFARGRGDSRYLSLIPTRLSHAFS